jgi:small subunit ribosomal protein S20
MPHHKSAEKRMRTNERDRKKNVAVRSAVKKATRGVRDEAKGKDAVKLLREAQSLLDNAVRKGVVHKKTADRRKSRLAKHVNKSQPKPA